MMVMYMLMVMKMMISYLLNYGTQMVCEQFLPLAHLKHLNNEDDTNNDNQADDGQKIIIFRNHKYQHISECL